MYGCVVSVSSSTDQSSEGVLNAEPVYSGDRPLKIVAVSHTTVASGSLRSPISVMGRMNGGGGSYRTELQALDKEDKMYIY